MRNIAKTIALIGSVVLPIACGGAAPPPPTAPSPTGPSSGVQTIAVSPPAEQPSVAEPPDTFALIRWRSPSRTFHSVQALLGLPVPINDLLDDLLRSEHAAKLVSLDSPVDAVFTLDPRSSDTDFRPLLAFSIGLRSMDEARQVFDKHHPLKEMSPGVYRVDVGRSEGLSCLLSSSVGSAPARLVCSDRERGATALLPYLTRGLPQVSMPDKDLHGELRFAPIQNRYGRQLPTQLNYLASVVSHEVGTGDRKFDTAAVDAMNGVAQEAVALLADLDGFQFDIGLDPDRHTADTEISLRLKSHSSWVAQRLVEKAGEAGPAPALFWRLPIDSDLAMFGPRFDPTPYNGLRQVTGDMLDGLMTLGEFPAAEHKAIHSLYDRLFVPVSPSVSASGHTDAAGSGQGSLVESMGWHILGMQEQPAKAIQWLTDLAAVYNRPSVKDWLVKKAHIDRKNLPNVKVGPFGTGLDKGTRAVEVAIPAPDSDRAGKAKPTTIPMWLVVMPDGTRTWLAWGSDRAALEKHLAMVKAGSPDSQTLASRPGLDLFKGGRYLSGGYMSMSGVTGANPMSVLLGRSSGHHDPMFGQVFAMLAATPNHGQSPILYQSTIQAGSPAQYNIRLQIGKAAFDDLGALISNMMGSSHHAGPRVPPPPVPGRPGKLPPPPPMPVPPGGRPTLQK